MRALSVRDRKFLLDLVGLLVDEGSSVHDVMQGFARSLRSFVQSREFIEQRRLTSLLKQATQAALAARDEVRPAEELPYELTLTSSRIRSATQAILYDPAERVGDSSMRDLDASEIDVALVGELVRQSEIDFRALRANLRTLLSSEAAATISAVLERFPAEQGLGSVVGYVALGAKHGELLGGVETVTWRGRDHVVRLARVPVIRFTRECCDELMG